ncbi:MAG: DUF4026 domain-containing protein [Oscillospiraceae bacterium]|nr:DUF4026 domain-containing protein [Oscillospiraceae bacterium]
MKESSLMTVIPADPRDIAPEKLLERMRQSREIIVSSSEYDVDAENSPLRIPIRIESREYVVMLAFTGIEIPQFYRMAHFFTDLDFQKIEKIETGLDVEIIYTDSFLASYHDQLKIINCLVPDALAVIDNPSEKLLSGKWIKLAAESSVPPAPRYLFTVQAISGSSDEVWLHSHGLKRCGLPDLEILCSDREMCQSHYSVIETFAIRMIENEERPEKYEPVFLAWMTDKIPMVATLTDWTDALEYYPEAELGKSEDRDDYHAEGTEAIMLYLTPDDVKEHNLSKVQELDDYLGHNTMFMISSTETARMRSLAQERIGFVMDAEALKDPDIHIMMKIGLHIDKEFRDPDDDPDTQREHIWFDLKSISRGKYKDLFICELTQDPYYVKGIKKGDIGNYQIEDITDWMIIKNEKRYTPDDAYLIS